MTIKEYESSEYELRNHLNELFGNFNIPDRELKFYKWLKSFTEVKSKRSLPKDNGVYFVIRKHSSNIERAEFIGGTFTNQHGYSVKYWMSTTTSQLQ